MSGIIYEGLSVLDGKPIVAIAITKSSNGKTGNMVQTFIMRSDIDPRVASQTGQDYSICGSCRHKGTAISTIDSPIVNRKIGDKGEYISIPMAKNRTCYVVIHQSVLGVWKKYKRGGYSHISPKDAGDGAIVRIGTYGDGAAVPEDIWHSMVSNSLGHTAYTHQWKDIAVSPKIYMASCDSASERAAANEGGYRAFRVSIDALDKSKNEVSCPASEEMGRVSTCDKCKLCSGTSANTTKDIVIMAHGSGKKHLVIAHD